MAEARAAGTIYDLGYQQYGGLRHGRRYAIWKLMQYSFRTAFGLGRGPRAKLVPTLVLIIVFMPAIVQVGVASFTNSTQFINYSVYLTFSSFLLALFTAAQAPELVVTDRQHGVLSLYLSRPLSGTDYAFAKLGALIAAMMVVTLTPQLFLFLGKVFVLSTPWATFKAEYGKLWPIAVGTLGVSCFYASIGLGLACLAARRVFATAAVIFFFVLTPPVSAVFYELASGDVRRYAVLANPPLLITGFLNWLFDIEARRRSMIGRASLPGEAYLYTILAVVLIMTTVLVLRYRKSEL